MTNPTSQKRPWCLAESNLATVRESKYEVAILPLGATEPHNLHLPYATDILEADWIGQEICSAAWTEGARVVLLPTIPFGTESNLQKFPLAINLQPSTIFRMLSDIIQSIHNSGIRKVVLLNSHGGNDLKPFLREFYGQTDVHLFLCNWYQMIADAADKILVHRDDHAGEMETSMIMAYRPDLIAMDEQGNFAADPGDRAPFRFEALTQGWVGVTRPWHLLTTNSGSGNPHSASADKGFQLMEEIKNRLVPFLVQLSQSPIDDRFPFA